MLNIPGKGFFVAGGLLAASLFAGCQSNAHRTAPRSGMTGQISPQMSSHAGSLQSAAPQQAPSGQQGSLYSSGQYSSGGQYGSSAPSTGQFSSSATSSGSGQTSGYPSSYPQMSR